jgi:hypothetical protein
MECNMARNVWALLPEGLVEVLINIQEPDARSWLSVVIELLPHVELTLTVVTLWSIWHTRRKALDEEVFQSPLSTFSFINRFISDLELIKPSGRSRTAEASPVPWCLAPPQGWPNSTLARRSRRMED